MCTPYLSKNFYGKGLVAWMRGNSAGRPHFGFAKISFEQRETNEQFLCEQSVHLNFSAVKNSFGPFERCLNVLFADRLGTKSFI